ncbi:SRPBCC domain-containing protein [Gorillibacterium timonense]|uniref:SRPBCC domain-containing protein n=1 Tax=Gorillibacterium timonense TaxID=1689269 RepID=UPI00071C87FB|nr:SRPBCC domain-containing protein [Gorillibacterium timonense]
MTIPTSDESMKSWVEEERFLVLERTFDAPRQLVFSCFSEANHLKEWWGPRGWDLPVCKVDFRPEGVWHYCMKCIDEGMGEFYGMESWGKAIYREIEAPERIVYTDYFSDEEGNTAEGMPDTLITLQFEDSSGKTRVMNRAEFESGEALNTVLEMGMLQGITETWDRLAEHLEKVK